MTDLITLSYLQKACMLSINENDEKYKMCLDMAQETLRDQVLGLAYYTSLMTQLNTAPNTFTTDDDALYENYIKKFLAWQTYYNYLKFANVVATPSGFRTHKEDNSDLATDIQMYSIEKNVLQYVNNYKSGIFNFMNLARAQDTTKYPLWDSTYCNGRSGMAFAITSIDKNTRKANVISVDKAIRTNE